RARRPARSVRPAERGEPLREHVRLRAVALVAAHLEEGGEAHPDALLVGRALADRERGLERLRRAPDLAGVEARLSEEAERDGAEVLGARAAELARLDEHVLEER